jgi:hypothetical protein
MGCGAGTRHQSLSGTGYAAGAEALAGTWRSPGTPASTSRLPRQASTMPASRLPRRICRRSPCASRSSTVAGRITRSTSQGNTNSAATSPPLDGPDRSWVRIQIALAACRCSLGRPCAPCCRRERILAAYPSHDASPVMRPHLRQVRNAVGRPPLPVGRLSSGLAFRSLARVSGYAWGSAACLLWVGVAFAGTGDGMTLRLAKVAARGPALGQDAVAGWPTRSDVGVGAMCCSSWRTLFCARIVR